MRCRLCGFEFEATTMACHAECPMGSHCNLICCPNCGYQVVDESKSFLARLLHHFWPQAADPQSRRPRPVQEPAEAHVVPLTHIPVGREVEVYSLEDMLPNRLARLSAFGLVPGGRVAVMQRRPAPVLRVGETELALGEEVLEKIWVHL